jgi:hypothetical protein
MWIITERYRRERTWWASSHERWKPHLLYAFEVQGFSVDGMGSRAQNICAIIYRFGILGRFHVEHQQPHNREHHTRGQAEHLTQQPQARAQSERWISLPRKRHRIPMNING